MNEDWVYAKSLMVSESNLLGILPVNYLRYIDVDSESAATGKLYLAIEDFNLAENGDLDFHKGEFK